MRGLVLGGGGAKGAYQVGAFMRLAEMGHTFDVVSGTSVGSLNAAFIAQFPVGQELDAAKGLMELWKGLSSKSVYRKWYHGLLGRLPFVMPSWLGGQLGFYNSAPLRKILLEQLDTDAVAASGRALRVNAIDLGTDERKLWSEADGEVLKLAVLASSSYPPAFSPVEIDGRQFVDGGAREILPITDAVQAGATDIVVIANSPFRAVGHLPKRPTGLDIAIRTIDAAGVEVEMWDLRAVEFYNALYDVRHPLATGMSHVDMKVIRPKQALLKDTLDFDPERIRTNIDRGYADASEAF